MRNLLNPKTTGLVIVLALLICAGATQKAHAELLYETVSDIQVPTGVTFGTQIEWQGHIVYEVKDTGTTYEVKIARDGEPHQYPYFYVSFTKQWEYVGTTRHVNPEAERKAAEDAKRAADEAARAQQAEQDRIRAEQEAERNKPKPATPEPPVVKPPDEEPEPVEPPEEEPNGDE